MLNMSIVEYFVLYTYANIKEGELYFRTCSRTFGIYFFQTINFSLGDKYEKFFGPAYDSYYFMPSIFSTVI